MLQRCAKQKHAVAASVADGGDEVRLEGTPGPDHIRGGRVGQVNGVNLNPATEGESPEPDLRLARTGRTTIAFRTRDGRDVVTDGGPKFGEPLNVQGFVSPEELPALYPVTARSSLRALLSI